MKKILSLLAAALIIAFTFSIAVFAAAVPEPTSNFFVNDFANVISQSDKNKMQKEGEALYKKCNAQVVVATIETLGDYSIEDYSLMMARSWKIGDADENNGILLLLAVKERKVRIEVGYGLEGALPDSKTGRILDTYGINYFKANDFSNGLAAVYNSLINEVYIEYDIEPDENYTPVYDDTSDELDSKLNAPITVLIIVCVVIYFILQLFFPGLHRRRRRGVFFGNGGGFSGGGFSSGGGGSGFSGGGGSFGGGGSSRGF